MTTAAGFILFRMINGRIHYLLLRASYGTHHWTPPKGHVNKGESLRDAAVRETFEETGYSPDDYEEVPGFKRTLEYMANGHQKTVVYWLAKLKNEEKKLSLSEEHQQFRWLPLEEAIRITYPSMQDALADSENFLNPS
ncbi:unnamed protein product [Soboliphyme baturini]|uniref:Bis(5'-nucleosyl)-tetraphosphatase [asymmetrical] n=1 Tax=Soboliphyme baturini TaxID=241478 RepID=A0A183IC65_9BILA|nr:unnamed protein product [Soboliphyme baturini]